VLDYDRRRWLALIWRKLVGGRRFNVVSVGNDRGTTFTRLDLPQDSIVPGSK
jgi:hypothetical protein